MKKLLKISLVAAMVTSSTVAAAPEAFANAKHHQEHHMMACMDDRDVGGIIILGLLLGAVTGGVGSAVAYGGAYAVGGAAIGGGAGATLGVLHSHHHCY